MLSARASDLAEVPNPFSDTPEIEALANSRNSTLQLCPVSVSMSKPTFYQYDTNDVSS